jgi:hypothetical protein
MLLSCFLPAGKGNTYLGDNFESGSMAGGIWTEYPPGHFLVTNDSRYVFDGSYGLSSENKTGVLGATLDSQSGSRSYSARFKLLTIPDINLNDYIFELDLKDLASNTKVYLYVGLFSNILSSVTLGGDFECASGATGYKQSNQTITVGYWHNVQVEVQNYEAQNTLSYIIYIDSVPIVQDSITSQTCINDIHFEFFYLQSINQVSMAFDDFVEQYIPDPIPLPTPTTTPLPLPTETPIPTVTPVPSPNPTVAPTLAHVSTIAPTPTASPTISDSPTTLPTQTPNSTPTSNSSSKPTITNTSSEPSITWFLTLVIPVFGAIISIVVIIEKKKQKYGSKFLKRRSHSPVNNTFIFKENHRRLKFELHSLYWLLRN